MIVSLFTAVLLVQILIYIVNAVGAKAINELVLLTHNSNKRSTDHISYGNSLRVCLLPRRMMRKSSFASVAKCYVSRKRWMLSVRRMTSPDGPRYDENTTKPWQHMIRKVSLERSEGLCYICLYNSQERLSQLTDPASILEQTSHVGFLQQDWRCSYSFGMQRHQSSHILRDGCRGQLNGYLLFLEFHTVRSALISGAWSALRL